MSGASTGQAGGSEKQRGAWRQGAHCCRSHPPDAAQTSLRAPLHDTPEGHLAERAGRSPAWHCSASMPVPSGAMCGMPPAAKQPAPRRRRVPDRGGAEMRVGVEARTRPLPQAGDAEKSKESLLGTRAGGCGK